LGPIPETGLPDFSWSNIPKWEKYTKVYQIEVKNTPNGPKSTQMAITFTQIFQSKAYKNNPKLGFYGLKIFHLATLPGKTEKNLVHL
jgi:hypothetical protein